MLFFQVWNRILNLAFGKTVPSVKWSELAIGINEIISSLPNYAIEYGQRIKHKIKWPETCPYFVLVI